MGQALGNISQSPARYVPQMKDRIRGVPTTVTKRRLLGWVQENDPGLHIPDDITSRERLQDFLTLVVKSKLRQHPCYSAALRSGQLSARDLRETAETFSMPVVLLDEYLNEEWEDSWQRHVELLDPETAYGSIQARREARRAELLQRQAASAPHPTVPPSSVSDISDPLDGVSGGGVSAVSGLSSVSRSSSDTVPIISRSSTSEPVDSAPNAVSTPVQSGSTASPFSGLNMDPQLVGEEIAIKLTLTEIAQTTSFQSLRQLLSPVLSTFDLLPQMGMFHSALMIGPWIIEWNNTSLVLPRKVDSRDCIFAFDVGERIKGRENIRETLTTLAKVIVFWNTEMVYDSTPSTDADRRWKGNCQEFVRDCLIALDLPTEFDGLIGAFIRRLRNTGKADMTYTPSQSLIDSFGLPPSTTFRTHVQLDQYFQAILVREDMFDRRWKSDYGLLKAFDRAFWLKYFKFEEMGQTEGMEHCQPLMVDGVWRCPFGNAIDAGSVILSNPPARRATAADTRRN